MQHFYELNLDDYCIHIDSDNFDRGSFDIPDTVADNYVAEDIQRFADIPAAVLVRASCFESGTVGIPNPDDGRPGWLIEVDIHSRKNCQDTADILGCYHKRIGDGHRCHRKDTVVAEERWRSHTDLYWNSNYSRSLVHHSRRKHQPTRSLQGCPFASCCVYFFVRISVQIHETLQDDSRVATKFTASLLLNAPIIYLTFSALKFGLSKDDIKKCLYSKEIFKIIRIQKIKCLIKQNINAFSKQLYNLYLNMRYFFLRKKYVCIKQLYLCLLLYYTLVYTQTANSRYNTRED